MFFLENYIAFSCRKCSSFSAYLEYGDCTYQLPLMIISILDYAVIDNITSSLLLLFIWYRPTIQFECLFRFVSVFVFDTLSSTVRIY